MRTRIAGGLFVSHLWSETDLKSHNKKVRLITRTFNKYDNSIDVKQIHHVWNYCGNNEY